MTNKSSTCPILFPHFRIFCPREVKEKKSLDNKTNVNTFAKALFTRTFKVFPETAHSQVGLMEPYYEPSGISLKAHSPSYGSILF